MGMELGSERVLNWDSFIYFFVDKGFGFGRIEVCYNVPDDKAPPSAFLSCVEIFAVFFFAI